VPVITVGRQFGAGGATVGRMLADRLEADFLDSKIIDEVARRLQLPKEEVEAEDEQHGTVYTPDTRAGKAGLMAFDLPNGEPPISIDSSALIEIGAAIGVIVLVMLWIGRHSDPVNRPAPLPRRRRA